MFRKNTASQFIHFQGVDSSTGGIKSGVSWTIRRCIDGTFAAGGGTVTEDGSTGWYKYAMAQADTNGNNIGFNFTGTGAVPQTVNIVTDGSPPDVNLKNTAGTAVTLDANNVLNVSVKYVAGTAQSAGDIYNKVSGLAYTGAGKVDASVRDWVGETIPATLVTGVPVISVKYLLGTLLTEGGAGRLSAGFIKQYDVASPVFTAASVNQTGDCYAREGAPAGVSLAADIAAISTTIGAAGAGLTSVGLATTSRAGIRKNVAIAAFEILMTDSTNHNPATGLTVSVTRSIDGAAFGAGTIANITEIANGWYKFDFGAGDLNGTVIGVRATATGADDLAFTIKTSP